MTPREAQEWLVLHSYPVGLDGVWGPESAAALRAFQAARGLAADAQLGPMTDRALAAPLERAAAVPSTPAPLGMRQALVTLARQHLAENPREVGGQNLGPWVRHYVGRGTPLPWCAGFLRVLVQQAAEWTGAGAPVVPSLSCDELAADARAAGRLVPGSRLAPGDLFLVGTPQDFTHTGLVLELRGPRWLTAEGNSNYRGDRNGDRALALERPVSAWGVSLAP